MALVKVLVVDDTPDIIETIQEIFDAKYPNAEVKGAASGIEAMKLMAEYIPDVVLLDIMMPEMDGWAVALSMHQNPSLKDIPIIYVTAKVDELSQRMGQISSEDYIMKPFKGEDLIKRVKSVVVKYKHLQNPLHPLNYCLLDAVTLNIPTMVTIYYLLYQTSMSSPRLTVRAFMEILGPAEYAKAILVFALTFIATLLTIDYIIGKKMPTVNDEKKTLHRINTAYWSKNGKKMVLEVIPLWVISFLLAYIITPTVATAPIYIIVPSMIGLYRIGYLPKRLQWS